MNAIRCILVSICLTIAQVDYADAMLPLSCSSTECGQFEPLIEQFQAGKPLEASNQLDTLIQQLSADTPSESLAIAYFHKGRFARMQSAYDESLHAFEQSMSLLESLDDATHAPYVLSELARLHRSRCEFDDALTSAYRALNAYQKINNVPGQAEQKVIVSGILVSQGRYEAALALLQHVLRIPEVSQQPAVAGRALYFVGNAYLQMEQYQMARQYLNDAEQTLRSLPNPFFLGETYFSKGKLMLSESQYEQARGWFASALTIFARLNASAEMHLTHSFLGLTDVKQGKVSAGMQAIEEAMAFATRRDIIPLQLELHLVYTQALKLAEEPGAALGHIEAGEELASDYGQVGVQAAFLREKAALLFQMEDYQQAYEAQQESQRLTSTLINEARIQPLIQQSAQLQVERQAESIDSLRRDKAIELAKAEQRNLRNMLILGSLVSLLMFLFLLYSRYNHRRQNLLLKREVKARTAELERKNKQLKDAYKTLEDASLRDPLTGLYNRYYLKSRLPGELKRSQFAYTDTHPQADEGQSDLLCYLIDIDLFKAINDEHGHLSGDRFLVDFTRIIGDVFRDTDLQIRWGGEEFLIICRQSCRTRMTALIERFRQAVKSHIFELEDGARVSATCSIGFCAFPLDPTNPFKVQWEQVFSMMDDCLYAAKLSGRDCWVGILDATIDDDLTQRPTHPLAARYKLKSVNIATSLNNNAAITWPYD